MAHVVCLINVEEDRATFTWSEGPASFEPYCFEGMAFEDLEDATDTARKRLSELVKDYLSSPESVPRSSLELAKAGHELFRQIFDPGAGQTPKATRVRQWLDNLRKTKTVDTLEIVMDKSWSFPINVVYDKEPDEQAFLADDDSPDRWRPFWAIRYNVTGGRKVDPLRRLPLLQNPDVLLVIDPGIRDQLPEEQRQRLNDFVGKHNLPLVHSASELKEAVQANRPELIYWMSHASPAALVLGDDEISPRELRKLLRSKDVDDPYELGGIAFLNACQTAEAGETGSFFDALHSVGFSGMVGTEHQTVDTFANPLGLEFLEKFLFQGEPVGQVMRRLRAHVPLGLLYGTYCPPDIKVKWSAKTGSAESSSTSVSVIISPHIAGSALGATATEAPPLPPLPAEPYRSLAYYDREDRALFAGRDRDVERFAASLDDTGTRMLILHGESGVGKSSFLRAGVIPYLEEECIGYRFLRTYGDGGRAGLAAGESVLFVRATNDLFGQLSQALCEFCVRPYEYEMPTGEPIQVDLPELLAEQVGHAPDAASVRSALRDDLALLGKVLSVIGNQLPFVLVLVIDQCEEVFSLAQSPEDVETGRLALGMLQRAISTQGDFKIVVSLRTEYYGRLIDRLRRGLQDTEAIREVSRPPLVTPPSSLNLTVTVAVPDVPATGVYVSVPVAASTAEGSI